MKGKQKIHSLPSGFVVKMRVRRKHRYAHKRSKTQGNYAQRLKCAWSCMAAQTNLNFALESEKFMGEDTECMVNVFNIGGKHQAVHRS